ncbi:NAC domain-containing protein 48-like [Juglans regia]|uniref:NAC domain-containing protein 48-like n=2 Tax=Juglans regia TaxID=51240 RepID=A0A2I4DR77_JUGRE|nr:NAC domain-containing protein 48-like [Juglans regia]XP_035543757.1 NAC domain-containing protein 48-like [Juglans regia]
MQTNFFGNIIPMIGYMYIYSMVYIYTGANVHGSFTDHDLPPGFRFRPTDAELVKHYLRKKQLSIPLAGPVFQEVDATDLYSTHPKCLVKFLDGEREWFFFIHEDDNSDHDIIIRRSTKARVLAENGGGFWEAWKEEDPICNEDGNIIAWKTDLTYFSMGSNSRAKKTHWTMQQYRIVLPHDVVGSSYISSTADHEKHSQREGVWVLCRLRRGREYETSF